MAWIYLIISGLFEIVWAMGLKYSEGFTQFWPSVVTLIAIVISFFFFSKALKDIAVGTSYAIFTGIGAAGTAVIGMVALNEDASLTRIFFLVLMLVGIVGIKLVSSEDDVKEEG